MIINNCAAAPKTSFRRGLYAHELTDIRQASKSETIIDVNFAVGKGEINAKDGALAQIKSAERHLCDWSGTLKTLKEHVLAKSRPNAPARGGLLLSGRDLQKIAEGCPSALAKASFGVATGKYDPKHVMGMIRHVDADKEPAWSPIHHFIKRTQEMIPPTPTQKFFKKAAKVLCKSVSWIVE